MPFGEASSDPTDCSLARRGRLRESTSLRACPLLTGLLPAATLPPDLSMDSSRSTRCTRPTYAFAPPAAPRHDPGHPEETRSVLMGFPSTLWFPPTRFDDRVGLPVHDSPHAPLRPLASLPTSQAPRAPGRIPWRSVFTSPRNRLTASPDSPGPSPSNSPSARDPSPVYPCDLSAVSPAMRPSPWARTPTAPVCSASAGVREPELPTAGIASASLPPGWPGPSPSWSVRPSSGRGPLPSPPGLRSPCVRRSAQGPRLSWVLYPP
jgi:hypothetical protein